MAKWDLFQKCKISLNLWDQLMYYAISIEFRTEAI